MADVSDVSNALVGLIAGFLYPNGSDQPSALGLDARIYAGWPLPAQLDEDMGRTPAVSHISIYPRPEEHNRTRYEMKWHEVSRNSPTLALTISGTAQTLTTDTGSALETNSGLNFITDASAQIVTLTGTVPPATNPHHVMLMVGGLPYVYAVQPTDTLTSIMTALGALVAAVVPGVVVNGAVIAFPPTANATAARVGITGTLRREIRRQERLFQVSIWANDPAVRDQLAKSIDLLLAGTFWLPLADDSSARLIFRNSLQLDTLQRQRIYRRDLFYTTEYAMFQTLVATEITQAELNLYTGVPGIPATQELAETIYS